MRRRHRATRVFAAVLGAALAVCAAARADPKSAGPNCAAPDGLTGLGGAPLARSAELVAAGKGPAILAMGSSSTQGVGASSPAASYPSRLEDLLREAFPGLGITVVNHGRGGQDAGREYERLARDVADEHPDLVIWQVGTNALLRRVDRDVEERLIAQGVDLMKQHGIDVVLMDLQYAPRVVARSGWPDMERLIAAIAHRERVGYFRRFEIMREWDRTGEWAPATLIGKDGLHMTDASYDCLARRLAQSLGVAWRTEIKLARSLHRSPAAFAGGGERAAAAAAR